MRNFVDQREELNENALYFIFRFEYLLVAHLHLIH